MKRKWNVKTAAILAAITAAALTGCGGQNTEETTDTGNATEPTVVKVGIVGDLVEPWEVINELLADEGIQVELVTFSDYNTPNQALDAGDVDLNAFQHYAFLNDEVEKKGYQIEAIGNTIIGPMNLYSKSISSPDELQKGDKIAIPNDVTNGGRALKALESAGLIKVDPAAGYTPDVYDVTENPLSLEFVEADAATLVSLLPDVAAAIINNNYAFDNGLDLEKDAIFTESVETIADDNPYINIIAARSENKDDPVYQKIVDAYHTDEVAKVLLDTYHGVYQPVWDYTYEEAE